MFCRVMLTCEYKIIFGIYVYMMYILFTTQLWISPLYIILCCASDTIGCQWFYPVTRSGLRYYVWYIFFYCGWIIWSLNMIEQIMYSVCLLVIDSCSILKVQYNADLLFQRLTCPHLQTCGKTAERTFVDYVNNSCTFPLNFVNIWISDVFFFFFVR